MHDEMGAATGDGMDRLLGVVLRDVRTAGVEVRVDHSTWQQDGGTQGALSRMLWAGDGSGTGIWLDLRLPTVAEQLVHLADQVQEWAIEELARTRRPTNWPPCHAHPTSHPVRASVAPSGLAAWVCPHGAPGAAPVGGLVDLR